MNGDHITCYYDGKKSLDAKDALPGAGKIGLWSKADAQSQFDDLCLRSGEAINRASRRSPLGHGPPATQVTAESPAAPSTSSKPQRAEPTGAKAPSPR